MKTVVVCGSRSWSDREAVKKILEVLPDDTMLIHGRCPKGADRIAHEYGTFRGWKIRPYPADWNTLGKKAGFVRNEQMLNVGPDLVIAFWDGESRGTKHMIDGARKRKLRLLVIDGE